MLAGVGQVLGDDMPSLLNVALGRNSDGHLEVVATSTLGSAATVWHAWEQLGTWTGWQPLGLPGGHEPDSDRPVAVSVMPRFTDGRLEAFVATERYQTVWHRWQTHPGTGPWSRWNNLADFDGPIEAGPSAIGLSDGRFAAFVVADGKVWHSSQSQADDEQWPPWSAFGKPNGAAVSAVSAAPRAGEFAELFALARSSTASPSAVVDANDLWHRWQTGPQTWSAWQRLGHPGQTAGPAVVAVNGDGLLEVFTIDGTTGQMWHRRQQAPDDHQGFSGWALVGDQPPPLAAAAAELDGTGRLVLAAITFGSDVWTTTETAAGSGTYLPWAKLAEVPPAEQPGTTEGLLTSPALMRDSRGLMQLFVTDRRTRTLYQISASAADQWQPTTGTAWPRL